MIIIIKTIIIIIIVPKTLIPYTYHCSDQPNIVYNYLNQQTRIHQKNIDQKENKNKVRKNILTKNHNNSNLINSYKTSNDNNDNDCIDDDDDIEMFDLNNEQFIKYTNEPIPSLNNVLMNHPRYVPNFDELMAKQTISTTCINVPIDRIPFDFVINENNSQNRIYDSTNAAADTGSSLNTINGTIALKYKSYIKKSNKSLMVRTGAGYVPLDSYLPVSVILDNNKMVKTRFWVL